MTSRRAALWAPIRAAIHAFYRVSMLPFGIDARRPRGRAQESPQLVGKTDALNDAAEKYFTSFNDTEFLLRKPFSDAESFSRHLFSLGAVFGALGLRRSDVIVEFGAGTCWVSHFLNKFGCKTISVDVSATALKLGREMFERDPATNWSVGPEFLPYDGHTIPLADGSCDKIVVNDAFHHVPNQREILKEMARILKPNGLVGLSEPGQGHADTDASRREVEQFGVLENELVIEDVGELAKACGFGEATILTASPDALWEVPTRDLGAFITGKGFVPYWRRFGQALLASHYIVLHKGDPAPTTRRPKVLRARVEVAGPSEVRVRAGESRQMTVKVTNDGDTRWLSTMGEGWTRVGGHLYRVSESREMLDFDWLRVDLPTDVSPKHSVELTFTLPPIASPGRYEVVIDAVVEGLVWFEPRGSTPLAIALIVEN